MSRPNEFTRLTQQRALERQRFRCASCGEQISALGEAGRADHQFGEGAQAHHVQHVSRGGSDSLANCVIVCQSCHYSAHEGGNYRFGTVVGRESDFAYFRG
jgi:5-methylcytosine-specific restriction endonuclease McrA